MPRSRVWTTQPPPGTPIDWDNPLAEGLVAFYVDGQWDAARQILVPVTGALNRTIIPGVGVGFTNWSTSNYLADYTAPAASVPFSAWADFTPATGSTGPVCSWGGGFDNGWRLEPNSNAPGMVLVYGGIGAYTVGSLPPALVPVQFLLSVVGTTANGYLDGELSTTATVGTPNPGNPEIAIGVSIQGNGQIGATVSATTQIGAAAFWTRGLTQSDAQQLKSNPWGIFWKRQRTYGIPASSGAAGTAAITEGSDTTAATGNIAIAGTASITEASDTAAATGAIATAGTAAITEGSDTAVASGAGGAVGTAAITESSDAVSGTGVLSVTGAAAITESSDTVSATGALSVAGSAGITENIDTVAATGAAGAGATAAIAEQPDIVSAAGGIALSGAAAIFEAGDIVVASGAFALPGSASITEGHDGVAGTGAGPQPVNPMPNFIGFPINYVIQILAAQGLAASLTYQIADPPGTTMGLITAQSPAPGQQLKAPVSFACTGAIALPAVGVRSGNVPALLVGNNDNPGGRSANS